jgi:hypothetical protein
MQEENKSSVLKQIQELEQRNEMLKAKIEEKIYTLEQSSIKRQESYILNETKEKLKEIYFFLSSISPAKVSEEVFQRYSEINKDFNNISTSIFYKDMSIEEILIDEFEIENIERQINGLKTKIANLLKEKSFVLKFKEKLEEEAIKKQADRVVNLLRKMQQSSFSEKQMHQISEEDLKLIGRLNLINKDKRFSDLKLLNGQDWLVVARLERIFK